VRPAVAARVGFTGGGEVGFLALDPRSLPPARRKKDRSQRENREIGEDEDRLIDPNPPFLLFSLFLSLFPSLAASWATRVGPFETCVTRDAGSHDPA
jgi:hypothetical protein